jgi:hypothetical protein
MKKQKFTHPRQLMIPTDFEPLLPCDFDETYRCGIFLFNIEKLLPYVEEHKGGIQLNSIIVSEWRQTGGLDDEYVDLADLDRPVILAEIAPDRAETHTGIRSSDWNTRGFVLIDGHHRVEKAFRYGVKQLPAYILPMEQHIHFMYSGFKEYESYWNRKLRDYDADLKKQQIYL